MRRSDQRRDAVFALYQRDVTGRPLDELLDGAKPFTRELAEGVDAHRAELDARDRRLRARLDARPDRAARAQHHAGRPLRDRSIATTSRSRSRSTRRSSSPSSTAAPTRPGSSTASSARPRELEEARRERRASRRPRAASGRERLRGDRARAAATRDARRRAGRRAGRARPPSSRPRPADEADRRAARGRARRELTVSCGRLPRGPARAGRATTSSELAFSAAATTTAGLDEAMRYSLLAGGKRIRPVLCLATGARARRSSPARCCRPRRRSS